MKKELQKALTEMDEVGFILLEHHMSIARMVRDLKTRYELSDSFISESLDVKPVSMKRIYNGSYEFDLRLLSKIQSMSKELAVEKAKQDAKFKVEAQDIEFPDYKYSNPLVQKLETLIDVLEKQVNKPQ